MPPAQLTHLAVLVEDGKPVASQEHGRKARASANLARVRPGPAGTPVHAAEGQQLVATAIYVVENLFRSAHTHTKHTQTQAHRHTGTVFTEKARRCVSILRYVTGATSSLPLLFYSILHKSSVRISGSHTSEADGG